MSYRVALPDGRSVEFPDEVSREEAARIIARQLGDTKPQEGFVPAAKAGLASLQQNMADLGANLGLRDRAGAQQTIEGLEQYKQDTFQPTDKGWTEAPWLKFKETLGGSLPYVLAPIGGGLAGGPAGAGLASLAQFTGSNLSRQREEGQEQQLGKAAAAAVPQAALDVLAFKMIPGIRAIMGVPENVAANIAKQGASKVAADYTMATGKAMGAEATTEAAQQFLERLQAGLETSPNDPQARKEYVDSLIGGAVLGGTLSVPGRYVERGRQQERFNEKKREEDAAFAKEEEVRQQAEAEAHQRQLQDPAYLTDIDKRWQEASARMEEFKARMKAVPPGEFAKEDKAEIGKAMNEYGQSDEYQSIRKAYKEARGQIASLKAKMGPEAEPKQQGLDLREPLELTPPEGNVGMPIQERMARIMQDPAAVERVLNGESFPDLSPEENEALRAAIPLQLEEQAFQQHRAQRREMVAQGRARQELEARQADLEQAAHPSETGDVTASRRHNVAAGRYQQSESDIEVDPLEDPKLDDTWEKALHAAGATQPVTVSPEIKPDARSDRTRREIEDLYGKSRNLQGIFGLKPMGTDAVKRTPASIDRIVAGKQVNESAEARARLDQFGKEGDPYARELVRLRDEQDAALKSLEGGLMDIDAGFFFGGASPGGASSFRDGVVKEIEEARGRYITATLQEAATHAAAAGKTLPQSQAIEIASNLRDRFDEYIQHRLKQAEINDEFRREGVERKNIKPTFERQVQPRENKSGLTPEEAAQLQEELDNLRQVRMGMVEPRLQEVARMRGPQIHALRGLAKDLDQRIARASQRLMRHIQDNGEAKAPKTQRRKPSQSFAEKISAAQRALVEPRHDGARVERMVGPRKPAEQVNQEDPVQLPEKKETPKPTPEEAEAKLTERNWQDALDRDVKNKLDNVSEAENEFLQARTMAMDSWRSAMREWKTGAETKKALAALQEAKKKLEHQNKLLARTIRTVGEGDDKHEVVANKEVRKALQSKVAELESEVQKAEDKVTALQRLGAKAVSEAELWVRALQNLNVQRKYQALDKARKNLEEAQADKADHKREGPAQKAAREARLAMDRAIKERDARSAELTKKTEEWTKKMVTGLDLPGKRHVEGVTEPIKTSADVKDEKITEELRQASLDAATVANKGKTDRSDIKPVAGPVTKDKGAVRQARRAERVKDGLKAREDDEAVQIEAAREANEDAAEIRKNLGIKEGDEIKTRAKMEADLAEVNATIAGLVTTKDKKKGAVDHKAIVEALAKKWQLEKDLAPYKEVDAKVKEAELKKARKEARDQKRLRKQKDIREKLNERNVESARRAKAVDEVEEDYDAFEAIMNGESSSQYELTDGGRSFKLAKDVGDITPDKSAPWHGMTLRKAAEWGAQNTKEPFEQLMFKRLAQVFSKYSKENEGHAFGGEWHDDDFGPVNPAFAYGMYNDDLNVVIVRPGKKGSVQTLLHELTHAATTRAMVAEPSFQNDIYHLLNKARDAWTGKEKDQPYGLTDAFEFLAEANSNPDFQLYLSQIPSTNPKQTLWDRFVAAVMKLLGLNNPSLLSDVLQVSEEIMKTSEEGKGLKAPNNGGALLWRNRTIDSAIFATRPSAFEKFTANAVGLGGRVQFLDRHAAISAGVKAGREDNKLTENQMIQAEHDLRMGEQTTQTAGQFLTFGPVKRVREAVRGGHLESYEAQKGANAIDIAKKLAEVGKAAGWDEAYVEYAMGTTIAGQRANALEDGWRRLAGDKAKKAQDEYNKVRAEVDANPEAKRLLKEAQDLYKEMNNGLIDFVVDTGAVTRERGAALKRLPYIPWYRVMGSEIKLWVEGEKPITIGSIADNPDLKELVGDNNTILPFWSALHQNTFMLSRMGLRNKATMETVNALKLAGFVSKMGPGRGPGGDSTIHYRVKGEDYFGVIDKDAYGIPAHLIVKGMEGIKTMVPMWVRLLGMPANILRRMVTRSPAYLVRQIVRDPTNAAIIGGVDSVPVLNSLKHIAKTVAGKNDQEHDLMRKLAISSNIYTGDAQDMEHFMRQIVGGQKPWQKALNFVDNLALQADASTRAAVYEDAINKGFTKAEAALRALEIQNFSRRGLSPGMQMLSTVIPFFNAQVQGLDVLYRSFKGDVPFAERLEIKKKLWARGLMLTAATMAYASMMQEDEDYMKARPQERYQNFLIKTPFSNDFVKIPIPFETGIIFKSLIEAAMDAANNDTTGAEALKGIGRLAWQSVPGGPSWWMPAAVAPAIQAAFGQTSFGPIESVREKSLEPWARYRENTSEVAKAIGEAGNVSPVMIDHFIRGYTGALGIAAVRMLDPALEKEGENPPSKTAADNPIFGSLFQRKESRYMIERAFQRMDELNKAQKTFKELAAQGKMAEARQFAQEKANEIAMADMAGMYKQQVGDLFKQERLIRNHPTLPQARKDELLKRLRDAQNRRAQEFFGRTEPR